MNLLLVVLLTAAPVLIGAWAGYRIGGGRTLVWLGKLAVAWGAGVAVAVYGLRERWHSPWGLLTPVLAGLLIAVVLRLLLIRVGRRTLAAEAGYIQRWSGTAIGAAIGFVLAVVGWQTALFFSLSVDESTDVAAPPVAQSEPAEPNQNSLASLADIARRGFLQHLPIAGPLTEELLAVKQILRTSQDTRKRFAKHKQWDALADLPSFQAIVDDEPLFADIEAAAAGNPAALYRLQRHPLIIDFYLEEPLQEVIRGLQASEVATELSAFKSTLPPESKQSTTGDE